MIDAYTTNAILGGITIAIELEVAISAVENGAENPPRSIIAGISTIPNAATVAGPEPEIAPKKQATITHTFGNTGFCHDITGQHEKRDRQQQKFADTGIHIGSHDRQ